MILYGTTLDGCKHSRRGEAGRHVEGGHGVREVLPGPGRCRGGKGGGGGAQEAQGCDGQHRQRRLHGVRERAPGVFKTPLTVQSPADNPVVIPCALKNYAEPEEIAGMASFLLSGGSSFVTGQVIEVSTGMDSDRFVDFANFGV